MTQNQENAPFLPMGIYGVIIMNIIMWELVGSGKWFNDFLDSFMVLFRIWSAGNGVILWKYASWGREKQDGINMKPYCFTKWPVQ